MLFKKRVNPAGSKTSLAATVHTSHATLAVLKTEVIGMIYSESFRCIEHFIFNNFIRVEIALILGVANLFVNDVY